MDAGSDQEDEEVDADVPDNEQDEPEAWKRFMQGSIIIAEPEEGEATFEEWEAFVRRWVSKTDELVNDTEALRCFLCAADPTIPQGPFTSLSTKHVH
jgi:hypothetical protein